MVIPVCLIMQSWFKKHICAIVACCRFVTQLLQIFLNCFWHSGSFIPENNHSKPQAGAFKLLATTLDVCASIYMLLPMVLWCEAWNSLALTRSAGSRFWSGPTTPTANPHPHTTHTHTPPPPPTPPWKKFVCWVDEALKPGFHSDIYNTSVVHCVQFSKCNTDMVITEMGHGTH